jgi:hypothetical protein
MNSSAVLLLVTWILPGPPQVINSYQTSFSSIEDCETARTKVLEDAQRLNRESRAKWTSILGEGAATAVAAANDVSVSAVCTGSDANPNPNSNPKIFTGTPTQIMAYEAYRWARVAAELGDAEAQANLGIKLMGGIPGLEWNADTAEGLKWLNRSAQHGCFDAFFYLSLIYGDPIRPNGYIPQNAVEGLKWLDIAISRKDVNQCNMFFDFYHGGRNPADVNRDPLKEQYDVLVQKMTTAQVAEAKNLAQEWKPTDPVNRQAWDRNEVTSGTRKRP